MAILIWIIMGGLVGWIASLIMGTDAQQGIILNVVVGIIGAIIGGWVMNFFGKSAGAGFDIRGFLVALLGACILIGLVKLIRK